MLTGQIAQDVALTYTSNIDELRELINRGVGTSGMASSPSAAQQSGASSVLGGRNPKIKYT